MSAASRYELIFSPEEDTPTQRAGRFRLEGQEAPTPTGTQVGLGIAQGGLDLASLPALALYPAQAGVQALLGLEDDGRGTIGQQATNSIQFQALDRIEKGQGSIWDFMLLEADDGPIGIPSGSLLSSINRLQEEIPDTGMTQEIARRGARSAPFFLAGPAAGAAAVAGEGLGLGARTIAEDLGATETEANVLDLIGGLAGGIGADLLTRGRQLAQSVPALLRNEGGIVARAEARQSGRSVQTRIQQIEQGAINEFNANVNQLSQKTFNEFPEFQAAPIAETLVEGNKAAVLDRIAPPVSKQTAWNYIKNSLNTGFERAAEVYRPLYQEARELAGSINFSPSKSIQAAEKGLARLQQIGTQGPGYAQAEAVLTSVIRDLGAPIAPKNIVLPPELRQSITRQIPVSNAMELKVRLNDIRNYENLTPTIKDQVIDPVLRELRQEIRQGLSKNNRAEQAFNRAETLYQETARKFEPDVISKARQAEIPERLSNDFLQPSSLQRLKAILSPQEYAIAERQIADTIISQGTEAAKRTLNELSPYLTQPAKTAISEGIALGDSLTSSGQRAVLQDRLLRDTQQSITTGSRPELLLNTMKTPEGYKIAEDTFKKTVKGREIFKAAERQVMADVFDSILNAEGRIDWQKAGNIFRDPQVARIIKDVGPPGSTEFFQKLSTYGYNMGKNMEKFGGQNPEWFKSLVTNLGTPAKTLLTLAVGTKIGIPIAAIGLTSLSLGKSVLFKTLSSAKVQNILRQLSDTGVYTRQGLMAIMRELNKELGEEDEL